MSLLLLFHGTPTPTAESQALFVEVGFGSGPATDPASITWTDITAVVPTTGVAIKRGRSSELDTFQAGTCSFTVDNSTRTFDPEYADGPYFGQLLPLTPVRVRYVIDSVSYPMFVGFVNGWPQTYDQPLQAESRITASDSFRVLTAADLPEADFSRETADARVSWILYLLNWTGATSIDSSQVVLSADPMTGKALAALQSVEAAEFGRLYVDAAGVLRFESRYSRVLETRSTVSQLSFTEADDGYADLAYDFSDRTIVNDARRTGASGVEQAVHDDTSIGQYLRRVDSQASLPNDVDPWLYSVCEYIVAKKKDPQLQIVEMSVDSISSPATLAELLTLGISDRVTVERTPQQVGDPISQDLWIEGVGVLVGPLPDRMQFTFFLSPADAPTDYFTLDVSSLDGSDVLAF